MQADLDSKWRAAFLLSNLLLIPFLLLADVWSIHAASPNIVISQVYGGGGSAAFTHDYIELFNRGGSPVDVTGWSVQYASQNGSTWQVTHLLGTIDPGEYYLVQERAGSGGTIPLPPPDAIGTIAMASMRGKVALVSTQLALSCGESVGSCQVNTDIVDFVGYGSTVSDFEGSGPAPELSATMASARAKGGCTDSDDNATDFATLVPSPRNSSEALNKCNAPTGIGSAEPAIVKRDAQTLIAVEVTPGTDPVSTEITVTADLSPINGSAAQVLFDDGTTGDAVAGDNIFTFLATVPPSTVPGIKSLAITITDQEMRSGAVNISLLVEGQEVTIHAIQGAGHESPMEGDVVTTIGIVTALAGNGFYLQTPDGETDVDPATSEGIFIFTSESPSVESGSAVKVTGTVIEFQPGDPSDHNLTITQIGNPGMSVTKLPEESGHASAMKIGAGGRTHPTMLISDDDLQHFDPESDGIDFYESLEGMLVQLEDARVVGPTNSFGETWVIVDDGIGSSPRSARGGIRVAPGDLNPERIQLDDDILRAMNLPTWPRVDVNTRVHDPILGVVGYAFNNYEVLVTAPITMDTSSAVEHETTLLVGNENYVTVGTFNVENLGGDAEQEEFSQRAAIIVNNLRSPDILVLEEVQDNSGTTNDGVVDASQTYSNLITAIKQAGGPTYDAVQIDPINNMDGGAPGGNIRIGFLVNTERAVLEPGLHGDSTTPTSVICTNGQPSLSHNPGRIDPANTDFTNSRKPLVALFLVDNVPLFVVGVHFNSKGGDDMLYGNVQPPILHTEAQRNGQALAVNQFVTEIIACDPDANVVVLGDINDFQFSRPVATLKGNVLNNLMDLLEPEEQYSYIWEGNSQVLDQAVVSTNLFSGTGTAYDVVHVNAEFAQQISDHDPSVARFCLDTTPPAVTVTITPSVLDAPDGPTLEAITAVQVDEDATDVSLVSILSSTTANGGGRSYTVTYQAVDGCGNVGIGSATLEHTPETQVLITFPTTIID